MSEGDEKLLVLPIADLAYDETLEALGRALDLRDSETAGHSSRVQRYSIEIAGRMGLSPEDVKNIGRGARVHDVGKIGIPDSILGKPGKLTSDERELMRTHTWLGFNLLRPVRALQGTAAQIVLSHHERFDGCGYPHRLKGESIPLGARIFAIADTIDAITTDRPYRRALSLGYACREIKREAGGQFDPLVAETFLAISHERIREIILSEKRRTIRLPLQTQVYCSQIAKSYRARSVDISEGGMLLENSHGLELGQELLLKFQLPRFLGELEPQAVAVRKILPKRLGVQFIALSPRDREALQGFIAEGTVEDLI
jgi:HD-GYP domain-containing protein (c-di-GMP phosphodiesterase class II)